MNKITIITPVFNGEKTIRRTIESVLSQNIGNLEYIIVDACSTDKTSSIIKSYENIIHICEPDSGIYDAMNKGVSRSKGDIIGIINADDYYTKDALSTVIKEFCKADIDILHGNMEVLSGDKSYVSRPYNYRFLYWGMCIRHPTCFIKKKVYEEVGLFDAQFRIAADYDFLLRAFMNKNKFYYIDSVLAGFSKGGLSDREKILSSKEQFYVRRKNGCRLLMPMYAAQLFFSKYIKNSFEKLSNFY